MSNKADIGELMRTIGPRMALSEITEFDPLNTWTLVVDDATILFAQYDGSRDVLVLSADVGQPAEASRLKTYDLLLRYNNLWPETGGVRMALDGEAGTVVQIFDLVASGLDLARLEAVLRGFIDKLRAWRNVVAGKSESTDTLFDLSMSGAIRI